MNGSVTQSSRADATSAAIVETAERLFRTLGYQKTTVADIARELRMSPANIYRFYPSKSAINEAVCSRILAGLQDRSWAIARGPGTADDRLRALFRYMQQETISLFFHEKRMHDMVAAALEEQWTVIDAHVEQIEKALRHVVMDGQASGHFARSDPDATAKLVHMTMLGFCHPQVVEECSLTDDLAPQSEAMAEFVLRALRLNSATDEC